MNTNRNKLILKVHSVVDNFVIAEVNVVATNRMRQLKTLLLKKFVQNFDEKLVSGSVMITIFKGKNVPTDSYKDNDTLVTPFYVNYGLLTSSNYINQVVNTITKGFIEDTKATKMHVLLSFNHLEWAADIVPNLEHHMGLDCRQVQPGDET